MEGEGEGGGREGEGGRKERKRKTNLLQLSSGRTMFVKSVATRTKLGNRPKLFGGLVYFGFRFS